MLTRRRLLDQIHQQFIDAVKQGRGNRLKESPDVFSGMFWTGQKSVELGLADGFGDADYVAREIGKQPGEFNRSLQHLEVLRC